LLPGFTSFEPKKRIDCRYHNQTNGDFSNTSSLIIPMQACIHEPDIVFAWNKPKPPDDYQPKWRRIGNRTRCYCYTKLWYNAGFTTKAECAGVARTTPEVSAVKAQCWRTTYPGPWPASSCDRPDPTCPAPGDKRCPTGACCAPHHKCCSDGTCDSTWMCR
jgi:hypothetical protein